MINMPTKGMPRGISIRELRILLDEAERISGSGGNMLPVVIEVCGDVTADVPLRLSGEFDVRQGKVLLRAG